MIEDNGLSPTIWDRSIKCATYIQNWALHKSVSGKTPYESWFGHKPNISHFRNFVSRAWAQIPLEKRKALKPQREECIMEGYG